MNHVMIYTKNRCSYCNNAKLLLSSKGIQYNELKLNEDFTREQLLELFPSVKTFPVIVVDGFNIGGFQQLKEMIETNNTTAKYLTEQVTP